MAGEMSQAAGTTTRIHPELPIFRLDAGDQVVLYTPGNARLTTRRIAIQVEKALTGSLSANLQARHIAGEMIRDGQAATRAWQDLATRPFEPECLTLYLSNQCNLACTYCYSMPADANRARARSRLRREPHNDATFPILTEASFPVLSEQVIAAAARLVARNCAAKGKPLTLVLHGGGEPTMHWELLIRVWTACSTIAAENSVSLWSYIATHGVLAEDRARWLAGHFNLVGLSCDGPPGVQNVNRPSAADTATSVAVERTAQVLHSQDADYVIRATITPEVVASQAEILEYLCDRLFARTVRFEPAYDGRREAGQQFQSKDADAFVSYFLEARKVAEDRGCDLQLSGVRLDEIHGPFCNPLREVLQLMPDGRASACFLSVGNDEVADKAMVMGRLDPDTGLFLIDHERVATQRLQATQLPTRCRECHNVYHCARDCPDVCLLAGHSVPDRGEGGFRCRVQKLLGRNQIFERAAAR